jgi:hypothetical protein
MASQIVPNVESYWTPSDMSVPLAEKRHLLEATLRKRVKARMFLSIARVTT